MIKNYCAIYQIEIFNLKKETIEGVGTVLRVYVSTLVEFWPLVKIKHATKFSAVQLVQQNRRYVDVGKEWQGPNATESLYLQKQCLHDISSSITPHAEFC